MFCPKCGGAITEYTQFCSQCGSAITAPAAAPPPGTQPVSPLQSPTGPQETSGKAIASLICGFFSLMFPAAIAAIITGHLAVSDIRKSAGRLKGRGMAVTGLVLGYLGVAIIPFVLIVAAIAIPNLLRARMAANETSAVGALRAVSTAAITYQATYANGFPPDLASLTMQEGAAATCDHPQLLGSSFTSGFRNGYVITYTPQDQGVQPPRQADGCSTQGANGYTITADPVKRGVTGQRSFFMDDSGVIRYETDQPATAQSQPLE